ncbi:ABC transporter substrate-binding protein [Arhodomonas sp. AD133]|uniref:ABC transporter substrate-binding protein n=1 Tax=Arhodomonas sp. AD133 TaxID=3415009 RepID=UPI003EB79688
MGGRLLRCCVLMLALATSATAGAVSDGVVRVLVLTDLKGAFSDVVGQGTVVASELAVEDVGETVAGAPVELVVRDSGADPEQALAAFEAVHESTPVDLVTGHMTVQVGRHIQPYAESEGVAIIHTGTSSDSLTNEACSPVGMHWIFDMHAVGEGIGSMVRGGADRWFFLVADYVYGQQLRDRAAEDVLAAGGSIAGERMVAYPVTDLMEPFADAFATNPDAVALAVGTEDIENAIRASYEPRSLAGDARGDVRLVVMELYIANLRRLGPYVTQGLEFVTSFYWNRNEATRAWSERFRRLQGAVPTSLQAATYSAVRHYLEAVAAVGDDDTATVLEAMRERPVDDGVFATDGYVRADGQMIHDLYQVTVKPPTEITRAADYLRIQRTLPGDEVFLPLSESRCERVAGY